MPLDKLIAVGLPIALGVVMIGAGAFNFIGPRSIHESLARWGIPPFSSGDGRARNDGRVAAARRKAAHHSERRVASDTSWTR